MQPFENIQQEILRIIAEWEPRFMTFGEDAISLYRNSQNRSIRQILGHLVDSASNNTHRIVHFQYRETPMSFPNYATEGNNDRWIAIQDYQHENWHDLVQLWKFTNLHISHVIGKVNPEKLNNEWTSSPGKAITLEENIVSYLPHLRLHLAEIEAILNSIPTQNQ